MLLATLTMEREHFQWKGNCIYCMQPIKGETESEHIIPNFMSGTVEIKDGSCWDCARQSNEYYENFASGTSFLAYRLCNNLRRRKKNEPRPLPNAAAGDALDADNTCFTLPMNTTTRPRVFSLPLFPPPTIYQRRICYYPERIALGFIVDTGRDGEISANIFTEKARNGREIDTIRIWVRDEKESITITERHDLRSFPLTLAKIAYCYAVAQLGHKGFDGRAIRDLLAGRRTDVYTFVGGFEGEVVNNAPPSMHHVHLIRQNGVLKAVIELFMGSFGGKYEVVFDRI